MLNGQMELPDRTSGKGTGHWGLWEARPDPPSLLALRAQCSQKQHTVNMFYGK
jgi:hypothetical protein